MKCFLYVCYQVQSDWKFARLKHTQSLKNLDIGEYEIISSQSVGEDSIF